MNPRYIITRITQLGLSGLTQVLLRKVNKKIFALIYKKKALSKSAFFSWDKIARKNKFPHNFDTFLTHIKQSTLINRVQEHELFKHVLPDEYKSPFDKLTPTPRLRCTGRVSAIQDNKNNIINWHPGFENKAHIFYQDIKIPEQKAKTFEQKLPDIKTPWDLSRFQDIYELAQAYKSTQDPKLAQIFEPQVSSWLKHNPYLLGVNWVCPMDVAIRAVNLIWGFHAFKNAPNIKPEFWENLTCSLYAHALYLESNWETSDRPNNHYLANLTGYYYLCHFFDISPKFKKKKRACFNKIYTQYNTQILPDGTCWEGSTAYHKLDTEMLLHVLLLCECDVPGASSLRPTRLWRTGYRGEPALVPRLHTKLRLMLTFLQDCTDTHNNFVTIGDNDSGKLITGIRTNAGPLNNNANQNIHTYPDFGLTIIKNKNIHVTFRHPKFNTKQPTGHFHQDENTVTLSINGQPILVDPGSYVYTANSKWRNYFRSYDQHNTFYITTQETHELLETYDLFQLPKNKTKIQNITQNLHEPEFLIQENKIIITNTYNTLQRRVTLNTQTKTLILNDSLKVSPETSSVRWVFIFSPAVSLVQDNKLWVILINQKPVAHIKSTLKFLREPSFYSPAYGTKVSCQKLVATKVYTQTEQTIFQIL